MAPELSGGSVNYKRKRSSRASTAATDTDQGTTLRTEAAEVPPVRVEYVWVVKNFEKLPINTENPVTSPAFSAEGYEHVKWVISMTPNGGSRNSGFMSLFVQLVESSIPKVRAGGTLRLLDENGHEICKDSFTPQIFDRGQSWGYSKYLNYSELITRTGEIIGLHTNGDMVVSCEILEFLPNQEKDPPRPPQDTEGPPPLLLFGSAVSLTSSADLLSSDLKRLLETGILTDVKLMVGSQKKKMFAAHKCVLAARSDWFKKKILFGDNLTETGLSGMIYICEIEPNVMEEILKYIYTGEEPVDGLHKNVLVGATLLGIHGLKEMCEKHLVGTISKENVTELLHLANRNFSYTLYQSALNFIEKNAEEMRTPSWQ